MPSPYGQGNNIIPPQPYLGNIQQSQFQKPPYGTDEYQKPPLPVMNLNQAEFYSNLPSVPPTSGVASLLHHQGPAYQKERRRLGLSAPDNYGGVKEQQFGYNPQPQLGFNRNQESPINIPGKQQELFQPLLPPAPIPQPQYFPPPPIQMPPPQPLYDPLQFQHPPVMYPQQQPYPMYPPPAQMMPPAVGGYPEYPRSHSVRQLYPNPPLALAQPQTQLPQQQQLQQQHHPQLIGGKFVQNPQMQNVQKETFFDKFGQEENDKRMASLAHQEKARRLRDELEQQIQEKKLRQEQEKIEREKWEMKYGQEMPLDNKNQIYYPPPGQNNPGGPFGGFNNNPSANNAGNPFYNNQPHFGGNQHDHQQNNNQFLNNSFSGPGFPQQQPATSNSHMHPLPHQAVNANNGVGALPSSSPPRNQVQLDDYKNELMVQIEEKRKKKEEEKKKKAQEDEREEMRVKKEMEELNKRYQAEINPNEQPPPPQQQQQQMNADEHNEGEGQFQDYHNNQHQNQNNQYNNEDQREMRREDSQYQQYPQQYQDNHNFNKQQSRKIEVHHRQIDFDKQPQIGPDSYPQMYENYHEDQQLPQYMPTPPQQQMDNFEPFKKQLQQQLQTFQKDILKMQHQQKQMMRNYSKEIESLQNKKQQIINEMKSEQDTQMKMQLHQLSSAIEMLTRKMNKQDHQPHSPHKHEIVAEVLHEIKAALPFSFQPQHQYSNSQSPPHTQHIPFHHASTSLYHQNSKPIVQHDIQIIPQQPKQHLRNEPQLPSTTVLMPHESSEADLIYHPQPQRVNRFSNQNHQQQQQHQQEKLQIQKQENPVFQSNNEQNIQQQVQIPLSQSELDEEEQKTEFVIDLNNKAQNSPLSQSVFQQQEQQQIQQKPNKKQKAQIHKQQQQPVQVIPQTEVLPDNHSKPIQNDRYQLKSSQQQRVKNRFQAKTVKEQSPRAAEIVRRIPSITSLMQQSQQESPRNNSNLFISPRNQDGRHSFVDSDHNSQIPRPIKQRDQINKQESKPPVPTAPRLKSEQPPIGQIITPREQRGSPPRSMIPRIQRPQTSQIQNPTQQIQSQIQAQSQQQIYQQVNAPPSQIQQPIAAHVDLKSRGSSSFASQPQPQQQTPSIPPKQNLPGRPTTAAQQAFQPSLRPSSAAIQPPMSHHSSGVPLNIAIPDESALLQTHDILLSQANQRPSTAQVLPQTYHPKRLVPEEDIIMEEEVEQVTDQELQSEGMQQVYNYHQAMSATPEEDEEQLSDNTLTRQYYVHEAKLETVAGIISKEALISALEMVDMVMSKREEENIERVSADMTSKAIKEALETVNKLNQIHQIKEQIQIAGHQIQQLRASSKATRKHEEEKKVMAINEEFKSPVMRLNSDVYQEQQSEFEREDLQYQTDPQFEESQGEQEIYDDKQYFGMSQPDITTPKQSQKRISTKHQKSIHLMETPDHQRRLSSPQIDNNDLDEGFIHSYPGPIGYASEEFNQHSEDEMPVQQQPVYTSAPGDVSNNNNVSEYVEEPILRPTPIQSPPAHLEMRINIAPPPVEEEDYITSPAYNQNDYQEIVPAPRNKIEVEESNYEYPQMSQQDYQTYQYIIKQQSIQSQENVEEEKVEPSHITPPWRRIQQENDAKLGKKSVKFDSESENNYQLVPKRPDVNKEAQNVEHLQQNLQQDQLYTELQQYERQLILDMNDQIVQSQRQSINLNQNTQSNTFPNYADFLYQKFLVNNNPAVVQSQDIEELSPRRQFFLQNYQAPQYNLRSQESDEELNPFPQQQLQQQPKNVYATSHPVLQPPQQNNNTSGQQSNRLQQLGIRPTQAQLVLRQQTNGSALSDNKEQMQKKIYEINRIAAEYDHVSKQVEEQRIIDEQRNAMDMNQMYLKSLKKMDRNLADKSDLIREQKRQQKLAVDIGEHPYEYEENKGSNNKKSLFPNIDPRSKKVSKQMLEEIKQLPNARAQQMKQRYVGSAEGSSRDKIRMSSQNLALQQQFLQQQSSSIDGLLNIAQPLSSIDNGKISSSVSQINITDNNSPTQFDRVRILPEIQPNNSGKVTSKETKQQVEAKPPLPPIAFLNKNQSRNQDIPKLISQQHQSEQIQLPPIQRSKSQTKQQLESSGEFQASIINIFNNDDSDIEFQPKSHRPAFTTLSSGKQQFELFEEKEDNNRKVYNSYKRSDPYSLRLQLQEKIYETSQLMRVDNVNLLQKVNEIHKVIKPSFVAVGEFPAIIDLAVGTPKVHIPSQQSLNAEEKALLEELNLIEKQEGQEEVKDEFSKNLKQWELQRLQSRRTDERYDQKIQSMESLPQNDNDFIKDIIQQRTQQQNIIPNTSQSIRQSLPPIQPSSVRAPSLSSQGQNSQQLLDFLRDQNKSESFKTNENPNNIMRSEIPSLEDNIDRMQTLPQTIVPDIKEKRPSMTSHPLQIPQDEKSNESLDSQMHLRYLQSQGGQSSYKYEEESRRQSNNFQYNIVENIVETPRNVFQLPQLMTSSLQFSSENGQVTSNAKSPSIEIEECEENSQQTQHIQVNNSNSSLPEEQEKTEKHINNQDTIREEHAPFVIQRSNQEESDVKTLRDERNE